MIAVYLRSPHEKCQAVPSTRRGSCPQALELQSPSFSVRPLSKCNSNSQSLVVFLRGELHIRSDQPNTSNRAVG